MTRGMMRVARVLTVGKSWKVKVEQEGLFEKMSDSRKLRRFR